MRTVEIDLLLTTVKSNNPEKPHNHILLHHQAGDLYPYSCTLTASARYQMGTLRPNPANMENVLVEHDQEILSGSRSACSVAIVLVWVVEIFFIMSLIAVVAATLLDDFTSPFPNVSDLLVMLGCALAAIVSIGFTGMAVGSMASAIANIDARNIQLEQLLTIRQRQQREFIAPARNKRTADIDSMRIRPERVT